ncbi:hypothetical protein BDF19DRAFT_259139 [Syncephalis fuscata]|nr:hypothetical protein BDF19DRAFT_259139 [Syncephalis fuscata]
MLRFASKKGASTVNTPCSDLGFWQFLLVIFKTGTALTTDELNGQDQQLLLRGTQRHRSNLLLSSISAPLLPLFTGVLRAANEQFDTDNNEETMTVLSKVLETAATCLKLLTTSLEEQFHPTLEHLADTILSALASWSLAVSNGISDGSEQMARPLYNMSLILLNEFAKLCRRQTNQRKVFMLMTDKLLAPLLDARYQHHQLYNKEASHSALITSIDSVLRRGLFHTDHLADFATVLKNMHTNKSTKSHGNNEGRDISSYQKALFNRLNELTKNEITSKQVNPILSVLLRFFIDESRRRQRSIMTNSGSGTEQSELLAKQLEFAFFADLYRISDASVHH